MLTHEGCVRRTAHTEPTAVIDAYVKVFFAHPTMDVLVGGA